MAGNPANKLIIRLLILNQGTGDCSVRHIPSGFKRILFRHLFSNILVCPADILKRSGLLLNIHLPDIRNCLKFQHRIISYISKFCTVNQSAKQRLLSALLILPNQFKLLFFHPAQHVVRFIIIYNAGNFHSRHLSILHI